MDPDSSRANPATLDLSPAFVVNFRVHIIGFKHLVVSVISGLYSLFTRRMV
ncbi:hypothetical protein [uncultured Tateyamaria sp.]|uniref:hypothetical protein n=1 Tax=uncultured Tateyamaria sp. TaxID=455651 RepID=UPI00260C681A|nr:hypothetical protein [uncultured Tateyamaria sp.]